MMSAPVHARIAPRNAPGAENHPSAPILEVQGLQATYGKVAAVRKVHLAIPENRITAIIGPSGCGKSTLIRCMNRMHEVVPGARSEGRILLEGKDIFQMDPVRVRSQVGMVFQRPNPFPTMSIFQNVAAGLVLNGARDRRFVADTVERSLKQAFLWEEVRDRLQRSALGLSGGQQQRLCIARSIALEPRVLLMDEPCSALDPIATARIEELLLELKSRLTIVMVTHNIQQAARLSDVTGFMFLGELVEVGPTRQLFTNPRESRTQDYITGRFG